MTNNCLVCGVDEERHRKAEVTGNIQHRFSIDGKLAAVEKLSTRKISERPQIMVVGAVDVALRQLLVDKGILTHEDVAALLDPGTGTAGNPGDRKTEGTD